jgi:phosphatidylinositol alpha-1,6-mannosyltransferase
MTGPPRTLIVTGHFPPEHGGVQTFTWEFVRRLPADRLVVVAPAWPGAAEFDAGLEFPVVRRHGYALFAGLPKLVAEHRLTVGWITALAPFGMYAPLIRRRAGLTRLVASTHGQEIGWVRALPTRLALRRASRALDAVSYLSEATLPELRAGIHPGTPLVQLAGGVHAEQFGQADGAAIRRRYRLGDGPVLISVSRLVRRKGQDMLLRAWPEILRRFPSAKLLIVGDGPMRGRLVEQGRAFAGSVVVTGSVPADELAAHYAAADLFVLACRDDRHGLQTEGLGLSALEAAAAGLPVVVGRSGGSPASVLDERTGLLVDPRDPAALAAAILRVLADPEWGRRLGRAGQRWARERWRWEDATDRLIAVLRGELPEPAAAVGRSSGGAAG